MKPSPFLTHALTCEWCSKPTFGPSNSRDLCNCAFRICTGCKISKPHSEYYFRSNGTLQADCKKCHTRRGSEAYSKRKHVVKLRQIFRNYGITPDEYFSLVDRQQGLCAICKGESKNLELCVDHDHVTGKVRGLLCRTCNLGLGHFKDNSQILSAAISYLRSTDDQA